MLNVEHGDNLSELLVAPSCLMEARRAKAAAERAEKEAEAAAGGDDNAVELFFLAFFIFFLFVSEFGFWRRTFHLFLCVSMFLVDLFISSLHFSLSPIRPGHEEEALLTARAAEAGLG